MAEIFRMPKLGMDMEVGLIGRWLKAEGETIKKGEVLAEIETDKALVEVEATCDGTVLKLLFAEGDEAACGTPIAVIGQPGEAIPPLDESVDNQANIPENMPAQTPQADDILFRMPKLGMDMEVGLIGNWLKAEGDTVKKGEPIAEIETDKALVEVESPRDGVLLKIFCAEGDEAPCGTPIAAIGETGQTVPDPQAPVAEIPVPVQSEPQRTIAAPAEPIRCTDRVIATPRARRAAAQNSVDLNTVSGTGENGRIVEQDVLDFMRRSIPTTRVAKDTVVPLAGMRKIIASRMRQSQQEMAQTDMRMDVDMTNMVSFRNQINQRLAKDGIKVSYVDLLTAVCAKARVEHPQATASLETDGIHYKNYANVGVAVDSERGLVVPVIRDADILSIPAIAAKSKELIDKARRGTLRPDDMQGGTFTISNLGMFEVDYFTAIVNPPETCILAVGRIADRAVVINGQIVSRPIMNLCLSYDHRIIDGAPAARFLQCIKHYLENPVWLLI